MLTSALAEVLYAALLPAWLMAVLEMPFRANVLPAVTLTFALALV